MYSPRPLKGSISGDFHGTQMTRIFRICTKICGYPFNPDNLRSIFLAKLLPRTLHAPYFYVIKSGVATIGKQHYTIIRFFGEGLHG